MLYASGVAVPQDLSAALSGIASQGTQGISDIYGRARQRQTQEGAVLGRPAGSNSYGSQRLAQTQPLAQGGLEASFGGQLGNTGYQNTLQQREFNQNKQLADAYAQAMRPDLLMQVLSGLGAGAGAAGQYAGLIRSMPRQGSGYIPQDYYPPDTGGWTGGL